MTKFVLASISFFNMLPIFVMREMVGNLSLRILRLQSQFRAQRLLLQKVLLDVFMKKVKIIQ